MVRRTRDIQKKIWLTPQEERTIAKKMEMIGTENFGAYAWNIQEEQLLVYWIYTYFWIISSRSSSDNNS